MISVLIGLAILSLAIIPLETISPGVAGQHRLRHGWLLDLIYWFFTALITKPSSRSAMRRRCSRGALPFFAAYAIFLHANVSWDFGALRAVLVCPRFHRWHHALA